MGSFRSGVRAGYGAALSAALVAACTSHPTELVVVVRSDLAVPTEIDRVHLTVDGPSKSHAETVVLSSGEAGFPLVLYLTPRERGTPTLDITAEARLGATAVVRHTVRTRFVAGESRRVDLWLERACAGVSCDDDETCAAGACRSPAIDATDLPRWDGRPPPVDGAASDGGDAEAGPPAEGGPGDADAADGPADGDGAICEPSAEACNGVDDDCDGDVDEGFDLETDARNCGGCGVECGNPPHADVSCIAGDCVLACDDDWADCDGAVVTGCETDLVSPRTCGSCTESCVGDEVCAPTGCTAACPLTLTLCGSSCADLTTDENHCGSCTTACDPHETCVDGGCECRGGLVECDGACVDILYDERYCGGCSTSCGSPAHGTAHCIGGECELTCFGGWDDCDTDYATGCESSLTSTGSCGTCAEVCDTGEVCRPEGCAVGCGALTDCGGECVDTDTDERFCGDCSTACGDDEVCGAGTCGCPAGLEACGGVCVDTDTDETHCGDCATVCDADEWCLGGACTCLAGLTDCSGSCVDTDTDEAHCGGCGVTCADGTCEGGECGGFGDGRDGTLIAFGTFTVNPWRAVATSASAGGTTITVGSNTGYPTPTAGDRVAVYQAFSPTGSPSLAGTYEYATVVSYAGGVLTVDAPLTNGYSTGSGNSAQVTRVLQLTSLDIPSGRSVYLSSLSSLGYGGILAVDVLDGFRVEGTLYGNGYGPDGKSVACSEMLVCTTGYQGVGPTAPTYGTSTVANGSGGGGGPPGECGGGGGGGHATAGSAGVGSTTDGACTGATPGGEGGAATGSYDLNSRILFGGSGGTGSTDQDGTDPGTGGDGGAVLLVRARTVVLGTSASIIMNGSAGGSGSYCGAEPAGGRGGGGGGAGGAIRIEVTHTADLGTGRITATGGTGGNCGGGSKTGGDGAPGRIGVLAPLGGITGTTSPAYETL